jgi:hypothetical protein
VLIDSGSAVVLIARRLANRLQLRQGPAYGIMVTTATGRSQLGGRVCGDLTLAFCAGTPEAFTTRVPAFVVEDAGAEAYEVLLGMRILLPLQFELLATTGNECLRLHPPGHDTLTLSVAIRWPHPAEPLSDTCEPPASTVATVADTALPTITAPSELPPPPAGGGGPE